MEWSDWRPVTRAMTECNCIQNRPIAGTFLASEGSVHGANAYYTRQNSRLDDLIIHYSMVLLSTYTWYSSKP
jgi:hypothetical protein